MAQGPSVCESLSASLSPQPHIPQTELATASSSLFPGPIFITFLGGDLRALLGIWQESDLALGLGSTFKVNPVLCLAKSLRTVPMGLCLCFACSLMTLLML